MAGAFAKTMDFLGLREPAKAEVEEYEEEFSFPMEEDNTVTDFPSLVAAPVETDLRRIVTVHPRTYGEAVTIGESFRSGIPVIMNLTGMSEAEARRMIDFAAGLTFGLEGSIEKVTSRVFLLSPASVTVSGTSATASSFLNHR